MAKELTSNVIVDGKWYGPDYPNNKATSEVLDQIENPAAFADPAELDSEANRDLRMRIDDGLDPITDSADDSEPARGSRTRRSQNS